MRFKWDITYVHNTCKQKDILFNLKKGQNLGTFSAVKSIMAATSNNDDRNFDKMCRTSSTLFKTFLQNLRTFVF